MLWTRFLGLGALAIAAYVAAPLGLPRDIVYSIVVLATVSAFVYRLLRENGPDRRTWKYMALGVACWGVGDGLVALMQYGGG
ncbi:MAG: hypothetical protein JHD12_21695, partial [Rhodococcus sp.]|nr:hypothetical protein [Rhodococcus sp. (in: high G+C Gram-positive bacteria)]